MATINYADKVAINVNPNIPEINKVTDGNMNLIKQVGNQILKTMGVYLDNWSSAAAYAVGDIVIYDNRIFRNLTGTNTATTPDQDTTNWEETTIAAMAGGADIPIRPTAPSNPQEDDLWIDTSENPEGGTILNVIFPIGSIIIKADNEDYSNWLGFTWERTLVGRVAVGIDSNDTDFDTIGETGGSKAMQKHKHSVQFSNAYLGSGSTQVGNIVVSTISGGVDTTETGTGNSGNLQPYQVVAYWKRTA